MIERLSPSHTSFLPLTVHARQKYGLLLSLLAAACFAWQPNLARYFYLHGGPLVDFLTLRFMSMPLVLAPLFFYIKGWRELKKVPLLPFLMFMLTSLGAQVFHFGATNYMSVPIVTSIIFLYPLITALSGVIMGKERVSPLFFVMLFIAFCAVTLVVGPVWADASKRGVGYAIMAVGCITANLWLMQTYFGHINRIALASFFGVTLGAVMGVWGYLHHLDLQALPLPLIGVGLLTGVIGVTGILAMWTAIGWIGAIRTSFYLKVEALLTVVIAGVFLGEVLEPLQYLGMGILLSVVLLVYAQNKKHAHKTGRQRRA